MSNSRIQQKATRGSPGASPHFITTFPFNIIFFAGNQDQVVQYRTY